MTDTVPSNCRYTKDHEWARLDGEVVVVGITAHAVEQLGDITLVTLPEPGQLLTQGEVFGDVDSVKAVSELYAPIDGEVLERNDALEDTPELINEDPYEGGWLVKVKPADVRPLEGLLDANAYQALLDDE